VRRALVPEVPAIRADLYKLNVMTQGGFFKPHKDTPRGDADTCFGTLVVVLPVPFVGGGLWLRHGDTRVELDWHSAMRLPWVDFYAGGRDKAAMRRRAQHVPTTAGLQFGAFFGDVEHEVRARARVCVSVCG
jgi:hypothetical protein